ncbi:MAG: hypothetical protein V4601_00555 [Pseudomonadota bacterium]
MDIATILTWAVCVALLAVGTAIIGTVAALVGREREADARRAARAARRALARELNSLMIDIGDEMARIRIACFAHTQGKGISLAGSNDSPPRTPYVSVEEAKRHMLFMLSWRENIAARFDLLPGDLAATLGEVLSAVADYDRVIEDLIERGWAHGSDVMETIADKQVGPRLDDIDELLQKSAPKLELLLRHR